MRLTVAFPSFFSVQVQYLGGGVLVRMCVSVRRLKNTTKMLKMSYVGLWLNLASSPFSQLDLLLLSGGV